MSSYEVGDTVQYSPFGGGVRTVLVLSKEKETGNRYQPGFTGRLIGSDDDTMQVWGYDTQIIAIRRAG